MSGETLILAYDDDASSRMIPEEDVHRIAHSWAVTICPNDVDDEDAGWHAHFPGTWDEIEDGRWAKG